MSNTAAAVDEAPLDAFQASIYFFAFVASMLHAFLFAALRAVPLAAWMVLIAAGFLSAFLVLKRAKKRLAAVSIAIAVMLIDVCSMVLGLGKGAGIHYYLLSICALIPASTSFRKTSVFLVVFGCSVLYCCFALISFPAWFSNAIPAVYLGLLHEINLVTAFAVIGVGLYRYSRQLISVKLELIRYHGQILSIANTDTLTKLPNRRSIEVELESLFSSSGEDAVFTAALGDVDDFKHINDRYGHECGDIVLSTIAGRFSGMLRNTDTVGRWGGEEFVFILRNANLRQAHETLDRVRTAVAASPVGCPGASMTVTITVGAAVRKETDTIKSLIARADARLYEGKKNGKNRVVSE